MRPFWTLAGLGALALLAGGCRYTLQQEIDKEIGPLARQVDDPPPPRGVVDQLPPTPPRGAVAAAGAAGAGPEAAAVEPAAYLQAERTARPPSRLLIPRDLPGADAPPIRLPTDPAERRRFFQEFYPPTPPVPPEPPQAPGPEGRPLTLSDLQRLAETYSPAIKSAAAAVEAARGSAAQAGAYPNPTFGWEHDTIQTGPAGYPGFFIDQLIKTGGKLTVAQASATMDLVNARLALRRARSDVRYAVRGAYFSLLVARENIRVNEALFRFAEEVYRYQVALLADPAAAYEPMQLRPLVLSARLNVITARNQYRTSWRQLAAALGLPDMPPTEVEGGVDLPVPAFDYDDVLARLRNHTDVLTASVNLQKAKYQLQLAKLQVLPDVDVRVLTQKDYTTPPNQIANTVVVSLPVPVWDQNRGGIYAAKWNLAQASVGPEQARNALVTTLSDAFNRYLTARQTVDVAGRQIRDQVRVYRALYARRQQTIPPDVSFGDLVAAQQTLAGFVTSYVTALGLQWQATVDVANLLQTEDLFAPGQPQQGVEPLPDLRCLIPPPDPEHTATAAERLGLIPSPLRKPPRPAAAGGPAPAGAGPACDAPAAPATPAALPAAPAAAPTAPSAAPAPAPATPQPTPTTQPAGPLIPLETGARAPAALPRSLLDGKRQGALPLSAAGP